MSLNANISDTPFNQRSPRPPEEGVLRHHRHTYIHTNEHLNWPMGRFSEKILFAFFLLPLSDDPLTKYDYTAVHPVTSSKQIIRSIISIVGID